jgi:hypothetical protein
MIEKVKEIMRTDKEIKAKFDKKYSTYQEKNLVSQSIIIELLLDIRKGVLNDMDLTDEQKEFLGFLSGRNSYKEKWFNEKYENTPPFWWRKDLERLFKYL